MINPPGWRRPVYGTAQPSAHAGAVYVSSWGAAAILRTAAPLTALSVFTVVAGSPANPADIGYTPGIGEIAVHNAGNNTLSLVPTTCAGVLFCDGLESF